jgi:magnesium-transporting ATPase (P-type)
MPIQPVQILWVNLVVAVALALPLAFEAQEPGLMARPPRPPDEPLLNAFLVLRTFLVSALMTAGAAALFLREYDGDLLAGLPAEVARAKAQTVTVTTIIVFQALYLLNCRSLTEGIWRIGLFSNLWVYAGIGVTLALQLAFVYSETLNGLFHTAPMNAADWVMCSGVALAGFLVVALEKRLWRRFNFRASARSARCRARALRTPPRSSTGSTPTSG